MELVPGGCAWLRRNSAAQTRQGGRCCRCCLRGDAAAGLARPCGIKHVAVPHVLLLGVSAPGGPAEALTYTFLIMSYTFGALAQPESLKRVRELHLYMHTFNLCAFIYSNVNPFIAVKLLWCFIFLFRSLLLRVYFPPVNVRVHSSCHLLLKYIFVFITES